MGSDSSIHLTAEQRRELHKKLSALRHDVNNSISLIAAATDLIQRRPETAERMWKTIEVQPQKILDVLARFSQEIEAIVPPLRSGKSE